MKQEWRFFVSLGADQLQPQAQISLSPQDSHHARDVLRLTVGAKLTVIDSNSGRRFAGVISELSDPVTVTLSDELPASEFKPRVSTLIFALCKGDKNEFVCEKATELGISKIILWQTARSIVKIAASEKGKKLERFQKILLSAAKQSNRTSIPEVVFALTAEEVTSQLHRNAGDLALCCSLAAEAQEIRSLLAPAGQVHIAIGPEGDFTDEEEEHLVRNGFHRITLGPTTLRSETAAIAAIAMVHGAFGSTVS